LRPPYLRGYPKAKGDKKEKERGQKEKLESAKQKKIKFGLWIRTITYQHGELIILTLSITFVFL